MPDLTVPVGTVADAPLSLHDLLRGLHLGGRLQPLLREAVVERVLLDHAAREGLAVTDQELQQAADRQRYRHGLTKADQTRAWLVRQGLTVDDFEAGLERDLLLEKLKRHVTDPHVAAHFAAGRDLYARARLRRIVVADQNLARELLAQMTHEDGDFAELARAHSLDYASRPTGGALGVVPRHALPATAAEAIFTAKPGAVVGPLAAGQGFHLFLVEEILAPELDEPTTAAIRRELFDSWLKEQLQDVRIDLSWLEAV